MQRVRIPAVNPEALPVDVEGIDVRFTREYVPDPSGAEYVELSGEMPALIAYVENDEWGWGGSETAWWVRLAETISEGWMDGGYAMYDADQDRLVQAENALCDLLAIPLDETEQGLSETAAMTIRAFCEELLSVRA